MKTSNVCCRIYKEQLNLINQLPKKERAIVLLDVINNAFNQFEKQNNNQTDNQIENQFDNAYISVSVSDSVYNSVSSISKAVIEILRKSIVCKGFSSNYGGSRSGAGKRKAEEPALKEAATPQAAPQSKRFVKPTLEEIKRYCHDLSYNIDAQSFFDFYESKGWKVGNTPMKNWQAALRNWARKDKNNGGQNNVVDYNKNADLGKYEGFGRKFLQQN